MRSAIISFYFSTGFPLPYSSFDFLIAVMDIRQVRFKSKVVTVFQIFDLPILSSPESATRKTHWGNSLPLKVPLYIYFQMVTITNHTFPAVALAVKNLGIQDEISSRVNLFQQTISPKEATKRASSVRVQEILERWPLIL